MTTLYGHPSAAAFPTTCFSNRRFVLAASDAKPSAAAKKQSATCRAERGSSTAKGAARPMPAARHAVLFPWSSNGGIKSSSALHNSTGRSAPPIIGEGRRMHDAAPHQNVVGHLGRTLAHKWANRRNPWKRPVCSDKVFLGSCPALRMSTAGSRVSARGGAEELPRRMRLRPQNKRKSRPAGDGRVGSAAAAR